MLTTPIHGLPYAETDDPVREYPNTVDAPKTLQLDSLLGDTIKDTGPRNISSLLINGWTVGGGSSVYIRRQGPWVGLRCYSMTSPATWNGTFMAGINGFMGGWYGVTVSGVSNAYANTANIGSSFIIAGTLPAGSIVRLSVVYPTTEAWPTVLPGVPG